MYNPRAEALKYDSSSGQSSSWQKPRYHSRNQYNSRPYGTCIPKETPKPFTTSSIPTCSASRTSGTPTQPNNSRLDFLNEPVENVGSTKRFIAMPSRKHWDEGYRPGWIIHETISPPEKYEDGLKMYHTYVKTGKVIYPKKKSKGDSTKATATSYMLSYTNKKKNK